MDTFQNTVTIAWPADEVFAFLADLRNIIMEWNYAIARTVQTSPGPAGVGASYRQTRTIPRRSEESLQITVFEPPSRPRPGDPVRGVVFPGVGEAHSPDRNRGAGRCTRSRASTQITHSGAAYAGVPREAPATQLGGTARLLGQAALDARSFWPARP